MTAVARPRTHPALALAGFLALCLAAAGLGLWAAAAGLETWYPGLAKPGWMPEPATLAPLWLAVHAAMGLAAWRVWRAGGGWGGRARDALTMFVLQLALVVAWPVLFFGLRAPTPAMVDLVVLWAAAALTASAFKPFDRPASLVMLAVLALVTAASAFNTAIGFMN